MKTIDPARYVNKFEVDIQGPISRVIFLDERTPLDEDRHAGEIVLLTSNLLLLFQLLERLLKEAK